MAALATSFSLSFSDSAFALAFTLASALALAESDGDAAGIALHAARCSFQSRCNHGHLFPAMQFPDFQYLQVLT